MACLPSIPADCLQAMLCAQMPPMLKAAGCTYTWHIHTNTDANLGGVQIAMFNVSVIDPNVTELHLSNGVANQVAADYTSDTGLDTLITGVQPGNEFTDVALFIDVNKDSLDKMAHVEDWNIG